MVRAAPRFFRWAIDDGDRYPNGCGFVSIGLTFSFDVSNCSKSTDQGIEPIFACLEIAFSAVGGRKLEIKWPYVLLNEVP